MRTPRTEVEPDGTRGNKRPCLWDGTLWGLPTSKNESPPTSEDESDEDTATNSSPESKTATTRKT